MKNSTKWTLRISLPVAVILAVFVLTGGIPGICLVYKIHTAAMKPTLRPVSFCQTADLPADRPSGSMKRLLLYGEAEVEITAQAQGTIMPLFQPESYVMPFAIQDIRHDIPKGLELFFRPGREVEKGARLAAGIRKDGDAVWVNKTAYWFATPRRGDLILVRARGIDALAGRKAKYIVKRVAGLPGETVAIRPPYLLVNGEPVKEPEIFTLISSGEDDHRGFQYADILSGMTSPLTREGDTLTLGDKEYFLLGDNPDISLDGRHYGGVKRKHIAGKITSVVWPKDRKRSFK